MAITIHLAAALWTLLLGISQLTARKGTKVNKLAGWSWVIAMVIVAVLSFGLTGFIDLLWGYSSIHLLSVWIMVCVGVSVYSARELAI